MKAKLTRDFVNRLEPDPDPRKRLVVWDTELKGFGVAVTPYTEKHNGERGGGVKSYIVQYRPGGRGTPTRRVTIGRHGPEWQPDSARKEAADILRQRRLGLDPFEERRRQRVAEDVHKANLAAEREAFTRFEYTVFRAEFIDRYAKENQPSSWKQTESSLKELDVDFAGKRIDRIERDAIDRAIDRLKKRNKSAPLAAHKAITKLYKWANDGRIFDHHPTQGMSPPGQSGIRTRVLSSAELRTIWQAADKLGYPFGHMYQLLVCTGLRLTNVAHLVMDEYHDAHEALIVSPERMKRKPNDVRGSFLMPLNIPALVVMETVRELEIPYPKKMKVGDRPVFTTNGMQPIAGFSHAKNLIDAEIAEIDPEMAHWTNHDLRRTMSTVMQPLGVSSRIIDLLQDHRDPEVSKTALHYQHWQFVEEKREAVALYGCYLQGVIDNNDSYRDLVKKVDFRLV